VRGEDERYTDANLQLWADTAPGQEPPELTAAQQRALADLVRFGRPVDDLPDLAAYPAAAR
jgi:hypothetical protein